MVTVRGHGAAVFQIAPQYGNTLTVGNTALAVCKREWLFQGCEVTHRRGNYTSPITLRERGFVNLGTPGSVRQWPRRDRHSPRRRVASSFARRRSRADPPKQTLAPGILLPEIRRE